MVGGRYIASGAKDDQMIETEFEQRLEALHAMSGRSNDGESVDERIIDELGVAGVSSRMPRHIVRFADFLSHRAIVGGHPRSRIAGHTGKVGDRPDDSACHRTGTGKIGMHYHIKKGAKLQRRGIESSLLTGLSGVVGSPGKPLRVGANGKGYGICKRSPHLDNARPGGSDVDRYLRQSSAARDPLVAAAVSVIEYNLLAAEEPVCGELLILGKSVIRHTQV